MLYGASKPKMWAAGIVALLAAIVVAFLMVARVKTIGSAWGPSVRAGSTIATLIVWLEPYVPSLHRDPGKDRYEMGLLLHDSRDASMRRYVRLVREQRASVLELSKLSHTAGRRIVFEVPEDGACDLDEKRVIGAAEVRADPSLARTFSVEDLATGDRATLRMLCSAAFTGPTRFLALLSEAEAKASFPIGLSMPKDP